MGAGVSADRCGSECERARIGAGVSAKIDRRMAKILMAIKVTMSVVLRKVRYTHKMLILVRQVSSFFMFYLARPLVTCDRIYSKTICQVPESHCATFSHL